MRRFTIPAALVTLGLVMAACGSSVPSGAPTTLGENEGDLNLIIWDGYAERGEVDKAYDWVTGFEKDTGCKVHTTPMTDSANGVQLLQSGQYDGGSFSGDATIRLMASGDVVPVNLDLIPNYKDVFAGLKLKDFNSKDGVPYGVPHGRGPNLLMWNTDVVTTAPTSWDPIFEGGSAYQGKISVYDSSIYIADAALHLMQKKPELGITNPYQLNDAQFAAAIDLLTKQRDNGAVYWGLLADQVQSFEAGDTAHRHHLAVPGQPAEGRGSAGPCGGDAAQGRLDRLVGHLDDLQERGASELHVPLDEPHPLPAGERGRRPSGSARRRSRRRRAMRPRRSSPATAQRSTPATRPTGTRSGTGLPRRKTVPTRTTRRPARTRTRGSRPGARSVVRDPDRSRGS